MTYLSAAILLSYIACFAEGLRHLQMKSYDERESLNNGEVFVINLKERKDRCFCASQQLVNSSYPVHRFEAIEDATLGEACPKMPHELWGSTGAASLTCSNYKIYQQLKETQKESPDRKWVMVLEDDFEMKPEFWTRVNEELQKNEKWGVLYIDSNFMGREIKQRDYLTYLDGDDRLRSSHCMVIKTSYIDQLIASIDKDAKPMDRMSHGFVLDKIPVAQWGPQIIQQLHTKQDAKRAQCDITLGQSNVHHKGGLLPPTETEHKVNLAKSTKHAFQC